ncbi:ABC transporter ATP-binding protein [Streptomyces sioyaensis]|uniref:ABC transporter ATP-binding protein n=1 Tax=Streptomyces sioyaensis TaxID=67364 RepID=UPI0037AF19EF
MSAGEDFQGLEVVGLVEGYGSKRVLHEVGFRVPDGRIMGFLGNNGAGKSTTMRIVLALASADSGQVRYDGAPMDAGTRRRIGYLPEEHGLHPRMRVHERLTHLGRLSDVLKERAAGSPVLFSSHQLDLVERFCDQGVIIADGRVRASGSVDALRRTGPVTHRVAGDGLAPGWTRDMPGRRR